MKDYINLFDTSTNYFDNFETQNVILPSVIYCEDNSKVYYDNDQYLIAVFDYITSISNTYKLIKSANEIQYISEIWIDGEKLPEVIESYKFSSTGKHIVKYKLVDPTQIRSQSFSGVNNIKSLIFPGCVKTINGGAFYSPAGLTNIVFNKVETIGDTAFIQGSNLHTLVFPDSITSIDQNAFGNCPLTSVTITKSTPPSLGSNGLGSNSSLKIYVPEDLVNTYKAAWGQYASKIEAISE